MTLRECPLIMQQLRYILFSPLPMVFLSLDLSLAFFLSLPLFAVFISFLNFVFVSVPFLIFISFSCFVPLSAVVLYSTCLFPFTFLPLSLSDKGRSSSMHLFVLYSLRNQDVATSLPPITQQYRIYISDWLSLPDRKTVSRL